MQKRTSLTLPLFHPGCERSQAALPSFKQRFAMIPQLALAAAKWAPGVAANARLSRRCAGPALPACNTDHRAASVTCQLQLDQAVALGGCARSIRMLQSCTTRYR